MCLFVNNGLIFFYCTSFKLLLSLSLYPYMLSFIYINLSDYHIMSNLNVTTIIILLLLSTLIWALHCSSLSSSYLKIKQQKIIVFFNHHLKTCVCSHHLIVTFIEWEIGLKQWWSCWLCARLSGDGIVWWWQVMMIHDQDWLVKKNGVNDNVERTVTVCITVY